MSSRAMAAAAILMSVGGVAVAEPAVGSGDTATAYRGIERPDGEPCVVTLFSDVRFADFTPKTFSYVPCAGERWGKIVFEGDFAVTAGRQYDRTANVWIGGVNVYFGTTMEPSRNLGRTWHVERDLSEYAPLFRTEQAGKVVLGNLVNDTYTGIITGSARLLFYPGTGEAADVVIPFSEQADGGTVLLASSTDRLARAVTLPRNIERAYMDVYAQSQGPDEFWFTCVPDELAEPLQSCGGKAFREAEVAIDGTLAGIAPVYPWLYTGAVDPYLWRPIPGVQTLNFEPYRVDLTPFAALLSDGRAHEIAIRVEGAHNYFMVAGALVLYVDEGTRQTRGGVLTNTLVGPAPAVVDDIVVGEGTATGSVTTTSVRPGMTAGVIITAKGITFVSVMQKVDFSNRQMFDISATRYAQTIEQMTRISTVTVSGGARTSFVSRNHYWPLTFLYGYEQYEDGTAAQSTSVHQGCEMDELVLAGGVYARSIEDYATPSSTLDFDAGGALVSTQNRAVHVYEERDTAGQCYRGDVAAENGLVTRMEATTGC